MMSRSGLDYDDPEVQDLLAEVRAKRRHSAQLANHPDPRDPDYPGVWGEDAEEE